MRTEGVTQIAGYKSLVFWLAIGACIPVFAAYDKQRLLLTAALSATALSAQLRRQFFVAPFGLLLAGGIALLFGLFSAGASLAPGWSLLSVAYLLLCVLCAAALGRDLEIAPTVLVGAGFVLPVAFCCADKTATIYAALLSGIPLHYPEPLRDFAQIRFFNQYQTWTLPFMAAALVLPSPVPRLRRRLWHVFVFVIGAFFWALFWRSSGRGTGYATLAASVGVACLFGSFGRGHAWRTIVLAGAGFLINLAMFGLKGGSDHLTSGSLDGRWYLWSIALEHIKHTPWLGIGPMMFAAIDNGMASHPHSAPLLWAVEWGLLAATLMIGCVLWLAWRWLTIAQQAMSHVSADMATLLTAVTASLIAGGLHALVSGVVVMPASQFMLVTVVAIAVSIARHLAGAAPVQLPPRRRPAMQALGILCVLTAVIYTDVFTLHDYFTRVDKPMPQTPAYIRNSLQPRYWGDGTLTTVVPAPIQTRIAR